MKLRLAFGLSAALLLVGMAHAQQAAQDQPAGDLVPPTSASDFTSGQLDAVLGGSWRSAYDKARDAYRHPKATLQFFGLQPDQTVIEITPGGGWYSEILAPLLRDNGHYIAAVPGGNDAESQQDADALRAKFKADPAQYGKASIETFNPKAPAFGRPGSADMVLTFRNVHNWAMSGTAEAMFKAFYAVLKVGGTLGVVDHRAASGATLDADKGSGYLPTDYVIKLATDAGFKLDGQSEINANPKDTKDYPKGVWTLPPTLALGQQDRARYVAIGESDRMTLRFVKVGVNKAPVTPATPASSPTAH
ncbi:class I SAM-dependent methyltransferase [Dyella jejuensis]|uniref:class I SAM-dependent methyltransferase n=1 Tax=Dyella jejuensis TaxID=1432009 RepID=UPI003850ECAA